MKSPYIALRDCVITGAPRPLKTDDRVMLSERQARYPLIRGWIQPETPEVPKPAPKPAKRGRKG